MKCCMLKFFHHHNIYCYLAFYHNRVLLHCGTLVPDTEIVRPFVWLRLHAALDHPPDHSGRNLVQLSHPLYVYFKITLEPNVARCWHFCLIDKNCSFL